jgi:hypothetical protein
VNNPVSSPTNILDTMAITNTFGNSINYSPPYEKWVSVNPGSYNSFVINIVDQNYNAIQANDTNILISLLLRMPKNKVGDSIFNLPTPPRIQPLLLDKQEDDEN